jgi:hypothetical protein
MSADSMMETCTANNRTGRDVQGLGAGLPFIRGHQRCYGQRFHLLYTSLQSKTAQHFQTAGTCEAVVSRQSAKRCPTS